MFSIQAKDTQEVDYIYFGNSNTILVISKNNELVGIINSSLSDSFNVVQNSNPLLCIELINKLLPKLVICDLQFEDFNIFEVCIKIKTDSKLSHIPLIIYNHIFNQQDQIACYEIGVDDFLTASFDVQLLRARIKNLITKNEKFKERLDDKATLNKASSYSFMDKIEAIIKENFSQPDFNVNSIIEKMQYSRSAFYNKYKPISQLTVNELINDFRLKNAKVLLQNCNLNISDIAYDCGFDDPAYFSRVFKSKYNMSPKEFRNQYFMKKIEGSLVEEILPLKKI